MRFGKRNKAMNDSSRSNHDDTSSSDGPIYYFGYGALVNPISRERRGVNTDEAHAALLPNYRLTFSHGGAATIVPQTGYEVYGIVMKCSTQADWDLLKASDVGYDCVEVDVFSLKTHEDVEAEDEESCTEAEEGFARVHDKPIKARVFVLPQEKLKDEKSDKLPQERYLKVIASGMRAYGVDPDYINDEIMGVEFIPSRKPQDYLTFPRHESIPEQEDLPPLSPAAWNKECARRTRKATKKNTNMLYCRLGQHAVQVTCHDPSNPFCTWVRERFQGPQDSTWHVVKQLFDPDLPLISSPEEVTPLHQAWAENQMVDYFQQCSAVDAKTIFRIVEPEEGDKNLTRMQAAFQNSFSSFRNSKNSDSTNSPSVVTAGQREHRPCHLSSNTEPQHNVLIPSSPQPQRIRARSASCDDSHSPPSLSASQRIHSKVKSIMGRSKLASSLLVRGSSNASSRSCNDAPTKDHRRHASCANDPTTSNSLDMGIPEMHNYDSSEFMLCPHAHHKRDNGCRPMEPSLCASSSHAQDDPPISTLAFEPATSFPPRRPEPEEEKRDGLIPEQVPSPKLVQ